jgi:hypothetical protein
MAGKPTFSYRTHQPTLLQHFAMAVKQALLKKDRVANPLVSTSRMAKRLPKHSRWHYLGRHQGEKECARRRSQMARGMLKISR